MARDFIKKYLNVCLEEMRTDEKTIKGKEIYRKRVALLASASDLDLKYLAIRIQKFLTDRSLSDIYNNMVKAREKYRNGQYIGWKVE